MRLPGHLSGPADSRSGVQLTIDPLEKLAWRGTEVSVDALLHGAEVVAGQEVAVGQLIAAVAAGPLDERLLFGQVSVADRVLGAGGDGVPLAEVGVADLWGS
jgi:hypothetical protein